MGINTASNYCGASPVRAGGIYINIYNAGRWSPLRKSLRVLGVLVLPVALLSNKLEHEPLKRGQRWNPCSTTWEQNTVMIIAHYLIIQELTALEGEQLIKWLSAFKMATKKWGIFILWLLFQYCQWSCVPSEVDEAVGDGQCSPHPDAPNATGLVEAGNLLLGG